MRKRSATLGDLTESLLEGNINGGVEGGSSSSWDIPLRSSQTGRSPQKQPARIASFPRPPGPMFSGQLPKRPSNQLTIAITVHEWGPEEHTEKQIKTLSEFDHLVAEITASRTEKPEPDNDAESHSKQKHRWIVCRRLSQSRVPDPGVSSLLAALGVLDVGCLHFPS